MVDAASLLIDKMHGIASKICLICLVAEDPTSMKDGAGRRKGSNFPASRVKKIMLDNEDIGKITPSTPVVLGRALELFLADFLSEIVSLCRASGSVKINENEVRLVVEKHERYGFLRIGNKS